MQKECVIPDPVPREAIEAVLFWRKERLQCAYATLLEPPLEVVVGDSELVSPLPANVLVPPSFQYLEDNLTRFHEDCPHERSVFVMMKFPEPTMSHWQKTCLEDLYGAVKDELERHKLTARRADQKTYAPNKQLWDNLCTYMLGCKFGVAILESHLGDEFNPNVALEYGFMKGLGREVILLRENKLKHLRADFSGTITKEFTISEEHVVDRRSVMDGIHAWLSEIGISPWRGR